MAKTDLWSNLKEDTKANIKRFIENFSAGITEQGEYDKYLNRPSIEHADEKLDMSISNLGFKIIPNGEDVTIECYFRMKETPHVEEDENKEE